MPGGVAVQRNRRHGKRIPDSANNVDQNEYFRTRWCLVVSRGRVVSPTDMLLFVLYLLSVYIMFEKFAIVHYAQVNNVQD